MENCVRLCQLKVKRVKGRVLAVNRTPSHSYEVSLAIWDHVVIPVT